MCRMRSRLRQESRRLGAQGLQVTGLEMGGSGRRSLQLMETFEGGV